MPKIIRSKNRAVVIQHSESELKENVGYRLVQLEKRVDELENQLKKLTGLFYIYMGDKNAIHESK